MPQQFTYYIPVLVTHEENVGFALHIYETDALINSEEEFNRMLHALTRAHVPEPEKGTIPVVPLNIVLLTAKRGPAVQPLKPTEPKH